MIFLIKQQKQLEKLVVRLKKVMEIKRAKHSKTNTKTKNKNKTVI